METAQDHHEQLRALVLVAMNLLTLLPELENQ
jgi:hypothetical protein